LYLAKTCDGSGGFLFADPFILLLLGDGLESHPGKTPSKEIQEDVAKGFHVISTTEII
jgi:hypothetical protein